LGKIFGREKRAHQSSDAPALHAWFGGSRPTAAGQSDRRLRGGLDRETPPWRGALSDRWESRKERF